jgi:HAD superfamily hydrolase (TIGR01458 family)
MSRNKSIKAVLVDLSGTVHIGDQLIPGAKEAVERLRDAGKRVKFLTNTSTKSSSVLLQQVNRLGVRVAEDELVTSVLATRSYLLQHKLRPLMLMEDTSDMEGVKMAPPYDSVVVGLAPSKFEYSTLNEAFRILLNHPNLIAIHRANYLRDVDGELSLGPGGFVTCLEAASNAEAIVMGKPSKAFFDSALWQDISAEETCMIGDDAKQDIQGSIDAGIGLSILVQTGKYRKDDESKVSPSNTFHTSKSIVEAVDYILDQTDEL